MRWHRDDYAEAVWSSDLRPSYRLVALAYADHAGDGRVAWLSLARLCARTGLSRDTANRALRALEADGWLALREPPRQHRSARYALTIPAVQQSDGRTPDESQQSDGRTAEPSSSPMVRASSPMVRASSPMVGPDLTSTSLPEPAAGADVITEPEDHDPHSFASFVDRLLGHGVTWDHRDVRDALDWIVAELGGPEHEPKARTALEALARRRSKVGNLGGYVRSSGGQLALIRLATGASSARSAPGCERCANSPHGRGFIDEDASGRLVACQCRRSTAA